MDKKLVKMMENELITNGSKLSIYEILALFNAINTYYIPHDKIDRLRLWYNGIFDIMTERYKKYRSVKSENSLEDFSFEMYNRTVEDYFPMQNIGVGPMGSLPIPNLNPVAPGYVPVYTSLNIPMDMIGSEYNDYLDTLYKFTNLFPVFPPLELFIGFYGSCHDEYSKDYKNLFTVLENETDDNSSNTFSV